MLPSGGVPMINDNRPTPRGMMRLRRSGAYRTPYRDDAERISALEDALARILFRASVEGLASYREAFEILESIEDMAREALRLEEVGT